MKTSHIPMRYPSQIFNHFNFICFTIRQVSQYQRNNKVIKIKIYPYQKNYRSSNLEILPWVSLIRCQFFEKKNGFHGFSSILLNCFMIFYCQISFIYFVIEVFISFIFLEKPASVWNQWYPSLVDARYQSDDAHQTKLDYRF